MFDHRECEFFSQRVSARTIYPQINLSLDFAVVHFSS